MHYELCTKKIEWYSALFDISKQVTINVTCLKATNTSYNNEAQNSLNENKTKETRHSVSEIHRTGEKMYICMVPPFSEFLNIRQLCGTSGFFLRALYNIIQLGRFVDTNTNIFECEQGCRNHMSRHN